MTNFSPDSFDPDYQLRVGPAAHAVDQLHQVQRRFQLLVAHLAESESGSLTGEVGPPLVQVAVEREDQSTALLGVQPVDQTADSRPHRRREIRHGELDHAANLAAAFAGERGRQPWGAGIPTSNCCAVGTLDSSRSAATAANRAETT